MTLRREAPARLLDDRRLRRLLDALSAPDEETRVVGGAVRNALLGRPVHEVDLATTALPALTAERASAAGLKAIPTGLAHGTVTIVVEGRPFEVTTLREDVETDGRHAVVRFGRDFALDAARRDFTINALSVDSQGRLHDYTDGLADLAAGRVRFIGDADTRIREDYLRILRFFRFAAEYGEGGMDRGALYAATHNREGLDRLSAERARAELLKLLAAPRAADAVAALAERGLLARLTGGVGDLGRLRRAVEAERDPIDRLAALAVASGADAARLRARLRLSNMEADRLAAYASVVVVLHGSAAADEGVIRRLAAIHGVAALLAGWAALDGEPRPVSDAAGLAQLARFAAGEPAPVFPLGGRDLLRAGNVPGRALGHRLAAERARWLESGCPATWDAD